MSYRWCVKILFVAFVVIFMFYFPRNQRMEKAFINVDLFIHSFNPTILYLTLNTPMLASEHVSITDKHLLLFHVSNFSMITMIFSEGYHQLDLSILDSIELIEYHQTMEISTGSQILLITVLNNQSEPMNDVFVHLELIDHPHIYLDAHTDSFGQVTFTNLPRSLPIYIEAIGPTRQSRAYIQVDHLDERNFTLILNDMTRSYDADEYDPLDRGYYAI